MGSAKKYLKSYEAIKNQAAARYPKRRGTGTSPAANKMISQQWNAMGGQDPQRLQDVAPNQVDWKAVAADKKKAKEARRKKIAKETNTLYIEN
jgi:hypothetical protein